MTLFLLKNKKIMLILPDSAAESSNYKLVEDKGQCHKELTDKMHI